eukprot:4255183-Pyramimonas_sp.AAC.1
MCIRDSFWHSASVEDVQPVALDVFARGCPWTCPSEETVSRGIDRASARANASALRRFIPT